MKQLTKYPQGLTSVPTLALGLSDLKAFYQKGLSGKKPLQSQVMQYK